MTVDDFPDADFDLDKIVAEIQEAARIGRETGRYPEGLEDELQSDFARHFRGGDPTVRFDPMRHWLRQVEQTSHFGASHVTFESGLPGGTALHKAVAKTVGRQVNGVYEQVRRFTDATVPLFQELVKNVTDPGVHVHDDLVHQVDVLHDRVATLQRTIDRLGASFSESAVTLVRLLDHLNHFDGLAARVEQLEAAERRRSGALDVDYGAFQDVGRGTEADYRAEYGGLADRLAAVDGPIVDLGAGRGELVALLAEEGAAATGVERDAALVLAARERGLDVREGDALDALRAVPLFSLGAVTLLHVAEHLHPNELIELIKLAHDRLKSEGLLIIETPNPQSLYVYARAFWLDPTHTKPVHPVYLEFLLRECGFREVEFEWTAPPADAEQLVEVDGDDPVARAVSENARRLNALAFGPQNYRAIARR